MSVAQTWLLVAVLVTASVLGVVAAVDLMAASKLDPGTRILLGLLALVIPVVGVPVWGLYRGHWQRIVAACWLAFAALALVNIGLLIPLSRRG